MRRARIVIVTCRIASVLVVAIAPLLAACGGQTTGTGSGTPGGIGGGVGAGGSSAGSGATGGGATGGGATGAGMNGGAGALAGGGGAGTGGASGSGGGAGSVAGAANGGAGGGAHYVGMFCEGYTDLQHLDTITTTDVCCSVPEDVNLVCPPSMGFLSGGGRLWCAKGANGNGGVISTDPDGAIHNGTDVASYAYGDL